MIGRPVDCVDAERAKNGDTVHVRYKGKLASNNKVFDTNVDSREPIKFELGAGLVVDGWERGLVDTCPGERLELTIPPELGYGAEGAGDGLIPPNSVLVFELTLEKVDKELKIEIVQKGDCSRYTRLTSPCSRS